MEVLDKLEEKIHNLLERIQTLEEENRGLKRELEQERETRQRVSQKLDNLLQKIDEADIL
ncbi:MAG: cell division protein ZapB [Desulfohalobiaceae bacterium]|nr:cell division protein ZapB [Desulfohalobiaceae bacterium]